jgi:MFS family permease
MIMAYIPRQNFWLALLLLTWGAAAAAMAAVKTIPQFLALRVLLGAFEAGALPGLWTYMAHFYCKVRQAGGGGGKCPGRVMGRGAVAAGALMVRLARECHAAVRCIQAERPAALITVGLGLLTPLFAGAHLDPSVRDDG